MKLLQLTSDNKKFNTINFQDGLNIVVGSQLTKEKKKSINGVGKSISLSLIHYMFGSSFKTPTEKKLEKYLATYGFFELVFSHKEVEYLIKKDFSQTHYYINGEKVLKTNYPKRLNKIFLNNDEAKPSFKHILNTFARRYSSDSGMIYYSNILTQQGRPIEDYQQQYTNLSLLGVDMALVKRSFEIKDKIAKLKKAEITIRDYEKALDKTNIDDIKDEIERLSIELENFVIAENFDKLKQEADSLTEEINNFRNEIFFKTKKLKLKELNYENSENTNVDIKKIEELFNEVNFFFEAKVTKRLEESQEFHNNLITNRKKRLSQEMKELNISLEKSQLSMDSISQKRDSILKDLNNKGALEERDTLKNRLKTLENEKNDLEKYEHILSDFKKDKSSLEVDDAMIKRESISYLEKNHKHFEFIQKNFRNLVKQFYDNLGGSFKIDEAPTAKYLFNINSHIPKEGSQGVGEVKIFCYDVLLYQLNKNVLNFLAHDGCLFSEMDRRQKSTIFKVILELIKDKDFQYFLNIGDNTLNEILDEDNEIKILTDEEKEIIKNSIRVRLSDKEEKNWLFGESFD